MAEENENALKHMFGPSMLNRLANSLSKHNSFDKKRITGLMPRLKPLEMKPRVRLIRDELKAVLPDDYLTALKILTRSMKDLNGFELWPHSEFIQTYGLKHPKESLEALAELTKSFTSEWAVRPFIKSNPKLAMSFLLKCASSSNVHLRRWASEGTRPRLPWGERLQDFIVDPEPTMKILEKLRFDDELYVRKSVANHLNDISKDHPAYVIKILTRWKKEAGEKHKANVEWIIRHSLRTLIKSGDQGALKLIGVSGDAKIKFAKFAIQQAKLKVGDRLEFAFEIHSKARSKQKLVIDYIIHFVKVNQKTAPKVFKLKVLNLEDGQRTTIAKSHHLKKITTRKYYSGEHYLEIQVNGKAFGKMPFKLSSS